MSMNNEKQITNKMMSFVQALGKPLVAFIVSLGYLSQFVAKSVYNCFMPPFYLRLFGRQFMNMGFYSLPVVGLTTLFAGMVIAIQTYSGISKYGAESAVATVVLISVTRELAPVLSALMVAGRIGAAMAAEIGTMRVTEQIDALVTLSTNPFKYLVSPRLCRIRSGYVFREERITTPGGRIPSRRSGQSEDRRPRRRRAGRPGRSRHRCGSGSPSQQGCGW